MSLLFTVRLKRPTASYQRGRQPDGAQAVAALDDVELPVPVAPVPKSEKAFSAFWLPQAGHLCSASAPNRTNSSNSSRISLSVTGGNLLTFIQNLRFLNSIVMQKNRSPVNHTDNNTFSNDSIAGESSRNGSDTI